MAGENTTHNAHQAVPANQREHAWPALLILLFLLGVLPQGPAPGGVAVAGEKAGAKASNVVARKNAPPPPAIGTDPERGSASGSVAELGEVVQVVEDGVPAQEELLPSTPENLDEIEQQAEGLLAGKKFDAAADFVRENEAALAVSLRLKQILVESLIQTEKPNWMDVGNKAQELVDQNPSDPVGNLALGMSWANRKTPDTARALGYLEKAKNSKRALPMALSIYWKVWAMRNLAYIAGLLGLVLFGGVLFSRSRRRRKLAADDLERALSDAQGAASEAAASPVPEKSLAKTAPKPFEKPAPIPFPIPTEEKASPGLQPARKDEETAPAPVPVTPLPVEPETPTVSAPEPVRAAPDVPSAEVLMPAQELPDVSTIDLAAAHIQAGSLMPGRPAHLPGREAELVWQNLVRQATSRPVPLDVHEPAPPPPPPPPAFDTSTAGDVTLDLSAASVTEELVTKLQMLAITDGELRTLLQMRNPEHLPALVEYITLKPDPVRLAFLARELGHYHDPAVSEILSTLLYHQDHRVGLSAIQGLQLNGGAESVPAICPFLESEVPALVESARAALTEFGPRLVLEGLARLPSHPDDRVRSAGVFVLSRMKGAAVSKLLVAMLGDKSADVRRKVLLAMAFQKNPAFVPTLREFVRQAPEEDRKVARKAIVYLQSLEKKPG